MHANLLSTAKIFAPIWTRSEVYDHPTLDILNNPSKYPTRQPTMIAGMERNLSGPMRPNLTPDLVVKLSRRRRAAFTFD